MDVIDSRRISKDDCQTDINDSKEGMDQEMVFFATTVSDTKRGYERITFAKISLIAAADVSDDDLHIEAQNRSLKPRAEMLEIVVLSITEHKMALFALTWYLEFLIAACGKPFPL